MIRTERSSGAVRAAPALNVLYYGREDSLPERGELHAGPLSATFEQGQLININWHGREVLRRIYVAVRDRDWGTVPLELSNLQTHSDLNSFRITFDARHQQDEIDFAWSARIEARDARDGGRLTFSMEGEALSTFYRSRIGFCLLHSVQQCAGKRFSALRPDGSAVEGLFPEAISREFPIPGTQTMTALSYDVSPGLRVGIQFEGDFFEMEDQRAWTDASFKTFCTPSHLAYPVLIERGTRIAQAVHLEVQDGRPVIVPVSPEKSVTVALGTGPATPLPEIGLATASHGESLQDDEIERLRALSLSHFPLYHVLADVCEFAGGNVLPSQSSEPLKVECLALARDGRQRVLLANMTGETIPVAVRGPATTSVLVKRLDERTVLAATVNPGTFRESDAERQRTTDGALRIDLFPYSVVRVDSGGQ